MENLCDLLFELSNEDRLRILRQLDKEAMNVTRLSKELGLTTQESSRHISRLGEVGLTVKDVDGFHRLTPFGELILKQLKGLEFTSQHKDYFTSHILARIPLEFVYRIGELADSTYVDDISVAVYSVDKVIREAEKYILLITDHYLMSSLPLYTEGWRRGVKVKNIEPKDWVVPPKLRQGFFAEEEPARQARRTGLLEERVLERLDIFLCMSEKEVAGVAFPLPDGRFDYTGFTAKDERSRRWCRDLFQCYWVEARNRAKVAEELYTWIKERPKAISALESIARGKRIPYGKELVSELESKSLIKQARLTKLGDLVYERLQQ